jgi:ribosomal protein S17E
MSNNKQSSVEKMFQEMIEIQQEGIELTFDENLALLEKYKAMHKEEIMNANEDLSTANGEQYYNETFQK